MAVRVRHLFSLLLVGASAGCGGAGITPPKTAPVKGAVHVKGKPAAGVMVKFHPMFDIGKVKYVPYGESGVDGQFTLSTGAGGNGAPRGEYVVTFEKPRIVSDPAASGIETEVDDFKGRYSDPSKSQVKVTVQSGENLLPTFQLD